MHKIYFKCTEIFKKTYLLDFVHIFCATSGQTDETKYIKVYISAQNSATKEQHGWYNEIRIL